MSFKLSALLTIFIFATSSSIHAQNLQEKFILAGDSWGQFLCMNNSFQKALNKTGHSQVSVLNCMTTTKMGAHASSWFKLKQRRALQKALKDNPDAKHMYLSLGGNDFLSRWKTTLSAEEEYALAQKITGFLKNIIADIQSTSPDIQIIVGGYDYGNFEDFSKKITGYTHLFKRMGKPTALQIHSGLIRFTNTLINELTTIPKVSYVHHLGLAHYYYGSPKCGIAPRTTPPPHLIASATDPYAFGGVPECVVSTKALLKLLGLQDAYHPSFDEFDHIAEHAIQQAFH